MLPCRTLYYSCYDPDSVMDLATGYGMGGRGVGAPSSSGGKTLSAPRHLDRLKGPSIQWGIEEKEDGAWSQPPTSNQWRDQEHAEL
jgi:hypothetical protein